jgi:hypothetical protein
MEKLTRRDLRLVFVCLAVIVAGAAVTALLFRKAFPEASIEFRVNRGQARTQAEKFLASRRISVAGTRFAGRFGIEEEPKVYLERELGLERAGAFYGRDAKIWRWEMRWVRSGVKAEERVAITPLGDLASFDSVRAEDAPGPRLSQEAARAISRAFLASRGLADLVPIEAVPISRPKRTDWTFVDERPGFRMGEATVRYATTVSGEDLTAYREFVHVPEAWSRDYQKLRSRNVTANVVGNLALFATFVAMAAVLVTKLVRRDVPWLLVGAVGAIGFVLSLLSTMNGLPQALFDYDTASPFSAFLTSRVVLGILLAVGTGAFLAFVIASAEPIYRERFPGDLALSRTFSARGMRTKRFFRGLIVGYALVAFFFAYQAVFYVVAARLGAWAPAEIPYDDILNTAFPWVTVLFIGFFPAVLEEGSSRMFSIAFLDRLGAGRVVAVVVPALIWGFNHTAYPNQPFYIRGVEVGLAGIAIGFLMLRFGILPMLVWHFTVDALYTSLLLLRSKNAYFVASGGAAALILLLPLAASVVLYLKRGGFEPETGLTNGELGFVPAPPRAARAEVPVAAARPLARGFLWKASIAAAVLCLGFLFSAPQVGRDLDDDSTGRARARDIARSFLRANGVAPDTFRVAAYLGTGFPDDDQVRDIRPEDSGAIPGFSEPAARYVIDHGGMPVFDRLARGQLPVTYWVMRFFQPEKKEEWKVLVDTRRSRVVAFVNPREEAAPVAGTISSPRAQARALEAAARLGYPAALYSVADVGTRNRPKRVDTTVVLESRPKDAGEARPRLRAVFAGDRLAAFVPSIQVPETYLREFRRRSAGDWLLLGARIVAAGAALGVAFILFLRIVREGFSWRSVLGPLAIAAVLAALGIANGLPAVFRAYTTEVPLSAFRVTVAVGLLVGWALAVAGALIAFVLISRARPGWSRAFRVSPLASSVARAVVAAAGFAGIARWGRLLAARFPAVIGYEPTLPRALETAWPGFSVLWSAARLTVAFAAAGAVIALAARQPFFQKTTGRLLAAAMLLLVLLPGSSRSPGEFAAGYLPAIVAAAWLGVSLWLLASDAAAWVLFGALTFGWRSAAELLAEPAPADRMAGWIGLVLVLAAVAALCAGRRRATAPLEPGPIV